MQVLALISLTLFASAGAFAQNNRNQANVSASGFSPAPYRIGERLSYNVSFSNFPTAAHVEMLVASRGAFFGREGIELRAHVETIGIVSAALYSINNDYTSYVDPATGSPFHLQQAIREGARSANLSSDFNQTAGTPDPQTRQLANSFPGTYDFLSALYRVRALPLAEGAIYHLTLNESVLYDVELKIAGRETVKTNIGSSSTIIAQARVPGNKEASDYRVRIYFTDDERHLPVLITAQHPSGEIRAELASTEMLNEPSSLTGAMADPATPVQPPGTSIPLSPAQAAGGGLGNPGVVNPNTGAIGATPDVSGIGASELPFKPGEQLNFNFFAGTGAQPIGTASLQVRARARYFNHDGLLLTSLMQTTGAGLRLFPVNDQINSYVDATTLLPFQTELRLQEGQRRTNWVVSVEQDRGNALFNDGTRVEMPVATHDLISVFYALRSFDLSVGRQNRVSLLVNKRPRLLVVTALQRETIELNGQRIPAVQLSLTTNEPQSERFALRLWVSTDRRRLPLRLTARTPLGPIRADLAIIPVAVQ